jgi:hypothetical protein
MQQRPGLNEAMRRLKGEEVGGEGVMDTEGKGEEGQVKS